MCQRQPQDGVAGSQQGVHGGGVGGGTRMWLHVGVFDAEEGLDAVDRQLLDAVDELAPAVIAPARVTLGVLVGQNRTLRLHHRQRRMVLRGDHLQTGLLATQFVVDQGRDVGVEGGQGLVEVVHQVTPFCRAYSAAAGADPPGVVAPTAGSCTNARSSLASRPTWRGQNSSPRLCRRAPEHKSRAGPTPVSVSPDAPGWMCPPALS